MSHENFIVLVISVLLFYCFFLIVYVVVGFVVIFVLIVVLLSFSFFKQNLLSLASIVLELVEHTGLELTNLHASTSPEMTCETKSKCRFIFKMLVYFLFVSLLCMSVSLPVFNICKLFGCLNHMESTKGQ